MPRGKKRRMVKQAAKVNPTHKLREKIKILRKILAEKTQAFKHQLKETETTAFVKAVKNVMHEMAKKEQAKAKAARSAIAQFEKKYNRKLAKKMALPGTAAITAKEAKSKGPKRRGRPKKST